MRCYVHSESGYGHTNEDVVKAEPFYDRTLSSGSSGTSFLCLLADGQGGQSGGLQAAQCAVQERCTAHFFRHRAFRNTLVCSSKDECAPLYGANFNRWSLHGSGNRI